MPKATNLYHTSIYEEFQVYSTNPNLKTKFEFNFVFSMSVCLLSIVLYDRQQLYDSYIYVSFVCNMYMNRLL